MAGPFVITGKAFGASGWRLDIQRKLPAIAEPGTDIPRTIGNDIIPWLEKIKKTRKVSELEAVKLYIKAFKAFSTLEKAVLAKAYSAKLKQLTTKGE